MFLNFHEKGFFCFLIDMNIETILCIETNKNLRNFHKFSACLALRPNLFFEKIQNLFFFFLLKLSAVCTFWIVLMC